MPTPRRISILGSTGSIGRNALDVIRRNRDQFEVAVLASRANIDLLQRQVLEFKPRIAVVYEPDVAKRLRESGLPCEIWSGHEGMIDAAAAPADMVLCAMVGAVGLQPLLSAIAAGNTVAIANKEPLVMAGAYIMEYARALGVPIIPVDSEHSALFQCLQGRNAAEVRMVLLTASGGPFHGWPSDRLRHVTPGEAARHPRWDMGVKISVDSATLMNKGLEIIEAMCLFGLRADQVGVVIHPQSIMHGIVEFVDGAMLAHMSVTDMKVPIAFALSYPGRISEHAMRLDITSLPSLNFAPPDYDAFPCLALAREAARAGGTAPAILNAANEEAVDAFCLGRILFTGVAEVVRQVLDRSRLSREYCLEAVIEADRGARQEAQRVIKKLEQ